MVDAVREVGQEVQILDPETNRVRTGDFVKISNRRSKTPKIDLCENPLERGHEYIHVEYASREERISTSTPLWVEITQDDFENNGYLKAELVENIEERDSEVESHFSTSREMGVEWTGTPQKRSDKDVKSREQVFAQEDVRGSKNDLL